MNILSLSGELKVVFACKLVNVSEIRISWFEVSGAIASPAILSLRYINRRNMNCYLIFQILIPSESGYGYGAFCVGTNVVCDEPTAHDDVQRLVQKKTHFFSS
jgi:hypothetical protein